MKIRPALLAGSWYPATERACREAIARFRSPVPLAPAPQGRILGGVIPHAGWAYSGPLAHAVLAAARGRTGEADPTDLLVVFGAHLARADPPVLLEADACETPLAPIPLHAEAVREARRAFPEAGRETADRPRRDNAVEVLLPLLAEAFPETPLLVLGVPPTQDAERIGARVGEIAGAAVKRPLFFASTDLTHYGPSFDFLPAGTGAKGLAWARGADERIARAMTARDARETIRLAETEGSACCPGAAAAAMAAASVFGARVGHILGRYNSLDVRGGEGEDFVGYAGIIWHT